MSFNPNHPLPKTTSDEVRVFHPYFHEATECALKSLSLDTEYEVLHHFTTSSGIVDFVIINKLSKKVLIPFEIKRTTMSTRSSGRRQARDYYNNLGGTMSSKYYCSSNLELFEVFKDSDSRKETHTQQVFLENENVGSFTTDSSLVFFNKLIIALTEVIEIAINDNGEYLDKLTNIRIELENRVNNISDWHEFFVPATFEYIIGMSENSVFLKNTIKKLGWPATVETYKSTPNKIITAGANLDFNQIFSNPVPTPNDPKCFNSEVLEEAYNAGKASSFGEDIAELVNSILKPHEKGIVETDSELARLLSVVAKDSLNDQLKADEIIWDPCAGSGRLLTSIEPSFRNVLPNQIWANEIKERFKQPLTLRLGMSFINSISTTNKPLVSIGNISEIEVKDCEQVKVVLMNPPFLSGIESGDKKQTLASKIRSLSGKSSLLNEGQIALEAVFLELVFNQVKNETVIACILPIQHLTRQSKEVENFRKFLVKGFGLTHIVTYPMEGLFSEVIKQTVIVVGRKNLSTDGIKLVEIKSSVANVDINRLIKGLNDPVKNPVRGVNISQINRDVFTKQSKSGWRRLLGAGIVAASFIEKNYKNFIYLPSFRENSGDNAKIISRGTLGNSGNARLASISKTDDAMKPVLSLIPTNWRHNGLNNSKNLPSICNSKTLSDIAIFPSDAAYEDGTPDNDLLKAIISCYLTVLASEKNNKSKQVKASKSISQVIKDLQKDQRISGFNEVLIPRATRKFASISILDDPKAIVSTNFIKVKVKDQLTRKLLASWLLSVFGQLQIELLATPQEGMRKLEVGTLSNFLVPDFSTINNTDATKLSSIFNSEVRLEFKTPVKRTTDEIWARVLNPSSPGTILDEAFIIFNQLVEERAP
tara:strand:- start:1819 stop:4452 length:2634 start_codon:yes stop_codon:yes gene_type:complete